ncbi:putative ribonuclease H-like domain-containing protein [Tanacetum coccineum]
MLHILSHDDSSLKDNGTVDQQVNTARPEFNTGSGEVSTALPKVNTATPEDLVGPIPTSEDTQVEDQEIELGNIPQTYSVPTTPHIRIHKDYPIEHVISDVQSSIQTRRMKTSYSEQGFLSAIYEGKSHQDLYTCLFACFLKRVSKDISDLAWVEAMQEELLQFKLQDSCGFTYRLVAQGHTQEEGIDYDEIFLHQAPRAWYDTLANYLLCNGFQRGKIDQTLFIKRQKGHILLVQIYVDDIIFGSTKKELCDEFEKLMKDKFQMSSMGELTFFLATQDRKSSTGGCQFLGNRLISWQCKKQTVVATSTTEAEYVAAASCCGQQFWRSAEASTDDNEEVQITATIDGHSNVLSRRHL